MNLNELWNDEIVSKITYLLQYSCEYTKNMFESPTTHTSEVKTLTYEIVKAAEPMPMITKQSILFFTC